LQNSTQSLYQQGRTAWPNVPLASEAFERHLQRLGVNDPPHASDLYLACACTLGSSEALAAFDREFLLNVPRFVAHIDNSEAFGEEVRQILREKLLLSPPGAVPKIGHYSGKGPLGGWVRVSAVRAAIDLRRSRGDESDRSELADVVAEQSSPEMAFIKARFRGEFQQALEAALKGLPPKDKNLLRMHFVDGLSIDRIGVVYNIHRATAARWIVRSRQHLLRETYRYLRERLRLSPSEFESLAALVRSQLDLHISRLLVSHPPGETRS
jgi:RNA polymerase sigma-70 factor (ECF subfamily)